MSKFNIFIILLLISILLLSLYLLFNGKLYESFENSSYIAIMGSKRAANYKILELIVKKIKRNEIVNPGANKIIEKLNIPKIINESLVQVDNDEEDPQYRFDPRIVNGLQKSIRCNGGVSYDKLYTYLDDTSGFDESQSLNNADKRMPDTISLEDAPNRNIEGFETMDEKLTFISNNLFNNHELLSSITDEDYTSGNDFNEETIVMVGKKVNDDIKQITDSDPVKQTDKRINAKKNVCDILSYILEISRNINDIHRIKSTNMEGDYSIKKTDKSKTTLSSRAIGGTDLHFLRHHNNGSGLVNNFVEDLNDDDKLTSENKYSDHYDNAYHYATDSKCPIGCGIINGSSISCKNPTSSPESCNLATDCYSCKIDELEK